MDTSVVLPTSTVIGEEVTNLAGEDLGTIEDIVFDLKDGRIAYAVLSFGGFLGVGDKLFAIPWSAMSMDPDENRFILDVDKEVLKNAPGFDKNNWPDMADRSWGRQIHKYYSRDPYWDVI